MSSTSSSRPNHHHIDVITYPKSTFKEYRHVRYCAATREVCMQDVLMVLGKEPWEYIQQCPEDDETFRATGWQLNWTHYKEEALKTHEPKCAVCGLISSPTLKRCSECIKHRVEVMYCGAKCQKEGWVTGHKTVCMKNASQARISEIERVIAAVRRAKRE